MDSNSLISSKQIDCLRELANIGVGKATTSLSQILNDEKITMNVPEVNVIPLKDVFNYLEPEEPVAAIFFEAKSKDLQMIIMFILPQKSAELIIKKVLNKTTKKFNEMELSALTEIGNIVNTSYLNALAETTGFTLLPTPPNIAVDMGGAVLGTIIAETKMIDDYIILTLTSISTEENNLNGKIFVFPFQGSLKLLFEKIGVS